MYKLARLLAPVLLVPLALTITSPPARAVQVLSFTLSGPTTIHAGDWASGGTDVIFLAHLSAITGDLDPLDPHGDMLLLETELNSVGGGTIDRQFATKPAGESIWEHNFAFHVRAYYDPDRARDWFGDPTMTGWIETLGAWVRAPGALRATCFFGEKSEGPFYGYVNSNQAQFDIAPIPEPTPIPEPASVVLLGAALGGWLLQRSKRFRTTP
jgi:hypothetical protein